MRQGLDNAMLSQKETQSKDTQTICIDINKVPDLLDLLWFAFSESQPEPFRDKALAFIRFIESHPSYQQAVFIGRKQEREEDCLCNQ